MELDQYKLLPCEGGEDDRIEEKVGAYADSFAPPEPRTECERLVFKAEDGRKIIGGCIVNVHRWGRAVLGCLWVDENYRGHGLGSMLIRKAEDAAREKGCYYLCLGTIDFQARPLYEKRGFQVFTATENFPRGHRSWSLSKRLDRAYPDYVPTHNDAAARFVILPGTKEDGRIIDDGLDRYSDAFAPDEREETELNRKLVDADGRLIAGIVAEVGCWSDCDLDSVWVDEAHRGQGLGSRLLREIEREAKEAGAYIMLTYACDWNVGFFTKNGYTVRGVLEDYPKGHRAYELQKLI